MAETRITKTTSYSTLAPGEWRPITSDGKWSARMACPGCGVGGSLADHEIDEHGNVHPSVDCTECEYHETGVVLVGWLPDHG